MTDYVQQQQEFYRSRWLLLGIMAWVSVCLIISGWIGPDTNLAIQRFWMFGGLFGLVSAVGFSEGAKREIRNLKVRVHTLTADARTDALTRLANRRSFDNEFKHAIAEWERLQTPLSLLLLDLDHFKSLNDNYGHQAGDDVLQVVAQTLAQTTRNMDFVARYGGEEFAAILPGTTVDTAALIAKRIRMNVASIRFAFAGDDVQVTLSVGLAQAESGEDATGLLKRADLALYAAKAAGRDIVFFHDGQDCHPILPNWEEEADDDVVTVEFRLAAQA